MSNLRLLNESSGTGVTTLSVTDVFTSDFDIYKIGKKHHFKLKYNRSGKLKKYNIAGFFNYCFEINNIRT